VTYTPSVLAAALLAVSAACWHGFAGHGWHRTLLARIRQEPPLPPPTEHSRWWHDLTRPRKIAMSAAILAAGVLAGVAWNLSPGVTMTACTALAGSTVVARSIRARLPRRGR
jgi:hypothetical protein